MAAETIKGPLPTLNGQVSAVKVRAAIVRAVPGGYIRFESIEDARGHPTGYVIESGTLRG